MGRLFALIFVLIFVLVIWAIIWSWIDWLFDWTARRDPQWSAFWIVVLARVFLGFLGLVGWFRWMVFLALPWLLLEELFGWNSPWWAFVIVAAIPVLSMLSMRNARIEELLERKREKEKSEEEDCPF